MNQKPILSALGASAIIAAPLITGKILRPDGSPIGGVIVQLKSTLEKDTTDAAGIYALGLAPSSSSVLSSSGTLSSSGGIVALQSDKKFSIQQNGSELVISVGKFAQIRTDLIAANGAMVQSLFDGRTDVLRLNLPRTAGVQYLRLSIDGQNSVRMLVNGLIQQQVLLSNIQMGLGLLSADTLILSQASTPMFKVGISAGQATIPNIYAVNRTINGSYSGGTPSKLQFSMSSGVQATRLYDINFSNSPFSFTTWSEWLPGVNWNGQISALNASNVLVGTSGVLNFADSTSKLSFAAFAISAANSSTLSSSTSSSSVLSSSSGLSYGTLTDSRDGKSYKTIVIGSQTWMAENLNYGTMISGQGSSVDQIGAQKFCYKDSAQNCATDGGLYQWHTALGISNKYLTEAYYVYSGTRFRGICPTGWHIPDEAAWDTLIYAIDTTSSEAIKMKVNHTGNLGGYTWDDSRYNNGNSSGFSALPAGRRHNTGGFISRGGYAHFWVTGEGSTETTIYGAEIRTKAYSRSLFHDIVFVVSDLYSKSNGFSVRCIKD